MADIELVSQAKEKLYFVYEASPQSRVEILISVIPDNVRYNYSPIFEEKDTLGRRTPLYVYKGGSVKSFQFEIQMHEDLLTNVSITKDGTTKSPTTIIEFVDAIKMLSYPVIDISGEMYLPKVYFQLGELAGYGIVKNNIDWQKPFRAGRYINVKIGFDVTIENEIAAPTMYVVKEQVDIDGIIYDYQMRYDISQEQAEAIVSALQRSGGTGTVDHLLDLTGGSEDLLNARREAALEMYNYQLEKIKEVYDVFDEADNVEENEDLETFKKKFDKLAETAYVGGVEQTIGYTKIYTEDEEGEQTEAGKITKMKAAFRSYLDWYYDNVDTTMTRDEYWEILDSVYTMLENLQLLAEEVYGYGSNS